MSDKAQQAQDMIQQVYEDGVAEINGREYQITKMTHKKRRKVFSFFTHVQNDIQRGDFWFLESDDWGKVESTIQSVVLFDGSQLSKLPEHWDKYPEDYMLFVTTMLGALSYPFLSGIGGS